VDTSRLIECYERLALLTSQMRDAAEQGRWDELIDVEAQRSTLLVTVKAMDVAAKLDGAAHRRKRELVEKILSHDGAIRSLVRTQMNQIQLNIESDQNKLRLQRAYGT
jgi:flagellar protein FliT